ncbi:MAG: DUF2510 domain-containing protein [Iamia sp.]
MRVGGQVLDLLPAGTSTAMLLLRLSLTALMWVVILAAAVEIIFLWALFILPIQFLARRRRPAAPPPPASGTYYPPPTSTIPPLPTADAVASREALDGLPDPGHSPALSNCAMCGGSTSGSTGDCLFCGTPLSMIPARGWHIDPLNQGARRWHDGTRWTAHLEEAS